MANIPLPGTGQSVNPSNPGSTVKKLGYVLVGATALLTVLTYANRLSGYTVSRVDAATGMGGAQGPWADIMG